MSIHGEYNTVVYAQRPESNDIPDYRRPIDSINPLVRQRLPSPHTYNANRDLLTRVRIIVLSG